MTLSDPNPQFQGHHTVRQQMLNSAHTGSNPVNCVQFKKNIFNEQYILPETSRRFGSNSWGSFYNNTSDSQSVCTLCSQLNNETKSNIYMQTTVYSLIYLRSTLSICFCWNRPLMINWLLPSIEPLRDNKQLCERQMLQNKISIQDKSKYATNWTVCELFKGEKNLMQNANLIRNLSSHINIPCPQHTVNPVTFTFKPLCLTPSTSNPCCEKKTMIGWRNVWSMKLRVPRQEADQWQLGERLWKKTVRHVNWTGSAMDHNRWRKQIRDD